MGRIKNHKGNTSILLVILVLASAISIYLSSFIEPLLKFQSMSSENAIKDGLALGVERAETSLQNTDALTLTANLPENISLQCLKNDTCAFTTSYTALTIVDIENNKISDGKTIGVDPSGKSCIVGDPNSLRCLFILETFWRPLCPEDGTPCINPSIEIKLQLSFANSLNAFPINFDRYNKLLPIRDVKALLK